MLRKSDKFTLSATNAINKDNTLVNFTLSFPVDEENFSIPDDIIKIGIYEYHEEEYIYGYESFKICVGKTTSISDICEKHDNNIRFCKGVFDEIKSADDKLCYFDDSNGMHHIFAIINDGDIVVDNIDDLKDTLIFISRRFREIKESILRIKDYNKEEEIPEFIDDETRENRVQMCIKLRKK